ncbi:helix-turn-helix domain-containing protein [Maridesulfovibrio sp.]|uniref:helix-turn-helix domain-containing protein n=1 Tax=Maridesulfovibrio sp. TaxID=2795000 RepID=UPI002A189C4B|nr:helix-turn-helix domain-containing protein [Maridesulfovibrio sp.]
MISGEASIGRKFPEQDEMKGMSAESLLRILGDEAAERLMYYWGGARVSVPGIKDLSRVRLRERIRQAYADGATPAQIAERFGISVRTAQRLRAHQTDIE